MAIALDTTSSSGAVFPGGASVSVSHTCTGTDLILWAVVYDESFAASVTNITAVTYNGVSMTLANSTYQVGQYGCSIWYLLNPATGSHTLTATRTSVLNGFGVAGMSYTGVKQSGQPDNSAVNRTDGNSTLSLTTVADNCWTILGESSGRNVTASTGTTVRQGSATQFFTGDSNGPITPAGSYSMSTTETAGGTPGRVMVSFSPVAVITNIVKSLNLLGVGI